MDLWELVARERIRDVYTDYTHAGDRMKLRDLAECFTEDGELAVTDLFAVQGREAIAAQLATPVEPAGDAGERVFVRHFIANLRFADVTPELIHTTAYFAVFTPAGPDHWGRYRDELVPVGDRWLFRRRTVTVDAVAPGSRFGFPGL
jgi:hypothetical protein